MEPSLSIQVILPLAAGEAIAGEFECIEPAHLFIATLKFAEFDKSRFEAMAKGSAHAVEILVKEHGAVCARLDELSIQVPAGTKAARHSLRSKLGKGRHRHDRERAIHRSEASRAMCTAAEERALAAGDLQWSAVHLLDALLESPSSKMINVLAEIGSAPPKRTVETPLLDRHGSDLTALAKEGHFAVAEDISSALATDAVCKVVAEEILAANGSSILLIQAGARTPRDVVETLAQVFTSDSPPKGAKGIRVIEISVANLPRRQTEFEQDLAGLLNEATQAGNVILWFSDFLHFVQRDSQTDTTQLLIEKLRDKSLRCIASTDSRVYLKNINPEPVWKRLFHSVWIHDTEAPLQL